MMTELFEVNPFTKRRIMQEHNISSALVDIIGQLGYIEEGMEYAEESRLNKNGYALTPHVEKIRAQDIPLPSNPVAVVGNEVIRSRVLLASIGLYERAVLHTRLTVCYDENENISLYSSAAFYVLPRVKEFRPESLPTRFSLVMKQPSRVFYEAPYCARRFSQADECISVSCPPRDTPCLEEIFKQEIEKAALQKLLVKLYEEGYTEYSEREELHNALDEAINSYAKANYYRVFFNGNSEQTHNNIERNVLLREYLNRFHTIRGIAVGLIEDVQKAQNWSGDVQTITLIGPNTSGNTYRLMTACERYVTEQWKNAVNQKK